MKNNQKTTIFIILFIFADTNCGNERYGNASRLRDTLLNSYNKDVEPILKSGDVLNCTVKVNLYGITNIDTIQGIISISIILEMCWTDPKLKWIP